MSDTDTDTNTVYIVSREKLIEFIENYIPKDAQFELAVLYEIMHRFVTPARDKAVMDVLLNEIATHHMDAFQEFIIENNIRKQRS